MQVTEDCFNQVVVTMVANNLKNEAHYFGFYVDFEFEGEIPTSNGGSGSCMLVSPAIILHGAYPHRSKENIICSIITNQHCHNMSVYLLAFRRYS